MAQKLEHIIYYFSFFALLFIFCIVFGPLFTKALDDAGIPVTQEVTRGITLACDSSLTLEPTFASNPTGLAPSSGPAQGDFSCTVTTNNSAGFNMMIENQDHDAGIALVHEDDPSYNFTNYASSPTYNWGDPTSGNAILGFTLGATASSEDAVDIVTAFKNNSETCGEGSGTNNSSDMDNAKCWRGLNDTTNIILVSSNNETDSNGQTYGMRFQARANAKVLKSGIYQTALTVTATY